MATPNSLYNISFMEEESNTTLLDINCSLFTPEDWAQLGNLTNGEINPCIEPPRGWHTIVLTILYGIVCLVGLGGNTLVIYVVVRFSKMQTVTNLYIVNLAIADECFLVGIPFLMTTMMMGFWPFGNLVCKIYFITTSINQITSSFFLLVMSADRYMAVCHPITSPKWRTPLIAKVVALTVWTISALLMVPIFIYANTLEIKNKLLLTVTDKQLTAQFSTSSVNCNIFWPESGTWSGEVIFIHYTFFTAFAIPLGLISIFYVLVIRRLSQMGPKRRPVVAGSSAKDLQQLQHQNNGAKARKKSHKKVTKLVLTVITVYFLCWAPYWIMQGCLLTEINQPTMASRLIMVLVYMPQSPETHSGAMLTMFLLCGCLSYSNSAMNPILYAFLSDNFKKSFLKACICATKDVNAALHLENSVFPRGKKHSGRQRKPSAPITSATYAGTTTGIETNTSTETNGKTSNYALVAGPSGNHLSPLIPHMSASSTSQSHLNYNNPSRRNTLLEMEDLGDGDSDGEMTAFLSSDKFEIQTKNGQNSTNFTNRPTSSGHCNPFGSTTNLVIPQVLINKPPPPILPKMANTTANDTTFVQKNGVHVTAL